MGELLESLRLGITPGIIVLIYLIIIKIIDTKKESNAVKINKEVTECFRKLNSFLDYITKDILNDAEEKRDYAIKNSFKAFANSIIRHATSVIIAKLVLSSLLRIKLKAQLCAVNTDGIYLIVNDSLDKLDSLDLNNLFDTVVIRAFGRKFETKPKVRIF